MNPRIILTTLLLALHTGTPAHAQADSAATTAARKAVQAQLNQSTTFYLGKGYKTISSDMLDVNALDEGDSDAELVYTLTGGREYLIYGVCDDDCGDLDINVYDAKGKLIASDEEDDDVPALTLKVTKTADYTIEVVMATCDNDPCFYAIDALQKK
ncbi:hypothetical protein [Deinococcus aquaticus]|uniref:hypothetical protein n=1 Tax=Deinococcus aquaticus TaxID=328692 RepID=UPI003F44B630